jgi:hypothetical protein
VEVRGYIGSLRFSRTKHSLFRTGVKMTPTGILGRHTHNFAKKALMKLSFTPHILQMYLGKLVKYQPHLTFTYDVVIK